MTANTYSADIGGNTDLTITAGQHALHCVFTWNDTVQELYDDIQRRIDGMRESDPLVGNGEIIRDYDWLAYYADVPTVSELEEWIGEQDMLPQSIAKMPTMNSKVQTLLGLKDLAADIQAMVTSFSERLYWQCTIDDENGDVTVADVMLGGTYRNQCANYGFSFRSEKTRIGKDDLAYLNMLIEVYDE